MGAVGLVVRAELRHRWRSWLSLALLVAMVGGLVLGATAAGRRTASAFPRFARTYGYDAFVYSYQPLPAVPHLPNVVTAIEFKSPGYGAPVCRCPQLTFSNFSINELSVADQHRYQKLVSGRWPDPSAVDEILISFSMAHDTGLHIGSTIRVPFYAPSQRNELQGGTGTPAGPTVTLRVVGIDAAETDFPSVGTASYTVLTTPAFARTVNPQTIVFSGWGVRLRHGAADAPAFDAAVTGSGAAGTQDVSLLEATVQATIHPQAVGWWVLAILAGIAGAAMIGQALSRQSRVEAETNDTLSALGLGPRQVLALGMARTLAVGVTGGIVSMGVAYALSPLAPVGEARIADPTTGPVFDATVIGLGALAVAVGVVLMGLWPAWRDSRGHGTARHEDLRRPSAVVAQLAVAGAPATTLVGVRRALERGSGRSAVPVGSALAGCAFAVAALCATAVFGSSLSNLTTTPRLYGQGFGVWFRNFANQATAQRIAAELQRDNEVTGITFGLANPARIGGQSLDLLAGQSLKGPIVLSAASGRLAARDGEIALGTKTLHQVGAHIGSVVRVTLPLANGGSRQASFRVVGTASFPPDFGVVGFDTGAIVTVDGYFAAMCGTGPANAACRSTATQNPALMAAVRPGPAGRADALRYAQKYPGNAALPVRPTDLVNFGEAVNFPFILGIVLVLFGAATLLHVLVVSVARRRRELGLLKAIGFVRHQTAAAVCWQATSVAVVGIVVGVPLGIVAGRFLWHAFAVNLGVVPAVVVPLSVLVLLGVGVIVVANALAAGPALVSARARAGVLLRSE